MATCTITTCHRALRPDQTPPATCYRCEDRMRSWLREITRQWPLLRACLQRDTGPRTGTAHSGHAHSPAPVRLDVLSLIGPAPRSTVHSHPDDQTGPTPILTVLQAWAEHTATERRQNTPALHQAGDCTTYLTTHLPWICTQPWATELHHELGTLITTIRRITHTQPVRKYLTDTPCACGAVESLVDQEWSEYIECRNCGRLYTRTEYHSHAAQHRLDTLTAATQDHDHDAA